MSPRPLKVPTDEILAAAEEVVAGKPSDWTLADIGEKVGLSAASLVHRFGSKGSLERDLIRFMNERDGCHDQTCVGDLVDVTCKGEQKRAGLLAFRLIAATSRGHATRRLAMGEG